MSSGDREWLEGMWAAHSDQVFAYAARRCGRDRAEDVVADTYVVAWRHRDRRPRRELPWLYGVARNVISERYRSDDRLSRLQHRASLHSSSGPTEGDGAVEAVAAVAALSALDDSDREALLLVSWEGLDTREAGAAMGITSAAFRMRLTRARRRLTAQMDLKGMTTNTSPASVDGGEDEH